jgi:glycerol-3-phosphate O-acyltransferase/dihydroxyacetone phosphate acyltransferase
MLVYAFLKVLLRTSMFLFYRRLTADGRQHFKLKGPLLVASNHPNTLMDALGVAIFLRHRIGFIGNASLFRVGWMARILRFLHVIPIYRPQDLKPGEQMGLNDDSFRKTYDYLAKQGIILIFPEGTSLVGKTLREMRTGLARIALGYEAERDFKGGLRVLPVSLNYSSSTHFRTRLHINYNEPIHVADYKEAFALDERATVRALTNALEERLEGGLVILDDVEQERMFQQVVRLYRERLEEAMPVSKPSRADFQREKHAAESLRQLKANDPTAYERLRQDLDRWFTMVDRIGLRQRVLGDRLSQWHPMVSLALRAVLMLIGLPFFLIGALAGWPIYYLPSWLAPRIASDIEYRAPIMMVLGLFMFPVVYGLETWGIWLAWGHAHPWWWTSLMGLALPVCGFLALLWQDGWEHLQGVARLITLGGRTGSVAIRLRRMRLELLHQIEKALGQGHAGR